MLNINRQFGKFMKRSADESQVSVLLKDFDDADKLLQKVWSLLATYIVVDQTSVPSLLQMNLTNILDHRIEQSMARCLVIDLHLPGSPCPGIRAAVQPYRWRIGAVVRPYPCGRPRTYLTPCGPIERGVRLFKGRPGRGSECG